VTLNGLQQPSSGGTTTGLQPTSNLTADITAAGSTVTTLLINSNITLAQNLTVPSNVTLRFESQGQVSVSATFTLTIAGPIQAAPQQIFAGAGLVALTGDKQDQAWVEWWGAAGDANGTSGQGTDSTAAINAALTALPRGGKVALRFAGSGYRISSTIQITNTTTYGYKSNQQVLGKGSQRRSEVTKSTWLYWDGNSTDPMIGLYSRESLVQGFGMQPNPKTTCSATAPLSCLPRG
jgi:hypothetical protein